MRWIFSCICKLDGIYLCMEMRWHWWHLSSCCTGPGGIWCHCHWQTPLRLIEHCRAESSGCWWNLNSNKITQNVKNRYRTVIQILAYIFIFVINYFQNCSKNMSRFGTQSYKIWFITVNMVKGVIYDIYNISIFESIVLGTISIMDSSKFSAVHLIVRWTGAKRVWEEQYGPEVIKKKWF